jgi:hypothetical protein
MSRGTTMDVRKENYPVSWIKFAAILIVIVLTGAFFYIYWNYPFTDPWNDTLLYFSFPLV